MDSPSNSSDKQQLLKIQELFKSGLITTDNSNFPSFAVEAYNNVLPQIGWLYGWNSRDPSQLDINRLTQFLSETNGFLLSAKADYLKSGISIEDVNKISSVTILLERINKIDEISKNDLLFAHVFSIVTLIELAKFREIFRSFLENTDQKEALVTEFVPAFASLSAAQDAFAYTWLHFLKVLDANKLKLGGGALEAMFRVVKWTESSRKVGKLSKWKPYEAIIRRHIESYLNQSPANFRGKKSKEKTRQDIESEIKKLDESIGKFPKGTFEDYYGKVKKESDHPVD